MGWRKPLSSCDSATAEEAGWVDEVVVGFWTNLRDCWSGCWNIIANFLLIRFSCYNVLLLFRCYLLLAVLQESLPFDKIDAMLVLYSSAREEVTWYLFKHPLTRDLDLGPQSTTGNAAGKRLGFAKEQFSSSRVEWYIMPPLFKIMFILLGIAPLLRLVITLVMMTCGMAVILWLAIVFQVMFKTSAALVVVYSIFSLILISLATVKTKTENQQRRRGSFALLKNSALRLVGVGF